MNGLFASGTSLGIRPARLAAAAAVLALSGCSSFDSLKAGLFGAPTRADEVGKIEGFLGGVVADEPQAALAGRSVLAAGGNAADAATAMGFTLAVTLPSRAGLGSSGACMMYAPDKNGPGGGVPEALLFPPVAPANPGRADRPASVPMLARGLFAMQARYGSKPIEALITPAEQLARFGLPVSRALVRDIAVVATPLSVDPGSRLVFFANGQPLPEGGILVQADLGATLAQLRVGGVGDLYQGQLGRRLEEAMPGIGGGLTLTDLRSALPRVVPALIVAASSEDSVAVPPLPVDGGLATAGALQILGQTKGDIERASARALSLAAQSRRSGGDATALLAGTAPAASMGPLPASTTFGALDRFGNAVMCGVSMGNLFGTGRTAPGTGILMGASPARLPPALISLAIAWNSNIHAFHAMAGGSGQEGAPVAAALGLIAGINGQYPVDPPDPGRVNVIGCSNYLPENSASCRWQVDRRGMGLAVGGDG